MVSDIKFEQFRGEICCKWGIISFKQNKEVVMGGALPMHIRSLIIEQLTKEGSSMIAVSKEHGLSYSTIRKLWKGYKKEGTHGLKPHYERCGPQQPKSEGLIYRCALWLKRHHPNWGAGM